MLPWIFAVKLGHIIHQEKISKLSPCMFEEHTVTIFADKYARTTAFNSSSPFFSWEIHIDKSWDW